MDVYLHICDATSFFQTRTIQSLDGYLGSYHFFQNALEGEKKLDLNQTGMSVTPQDVVEEKPFFNLGTPTFRNGNGNVIDTST